MICNRQLAHKRLGPLGSLPLKGRPAAGIAYVLGAVQKFWKIPAYTLGPGVVFALGFMIYASIGACVLGNADPKFGCVGTVELASLIAALVLAASSLGLFLVSVFYYSVIQALAVPWLLGLLAILVAVQGLLWWSPVLGLAESVEGIFFSWIFASTMSGWFALVVTRRLVSRKN